MIYPTRRAIFAIALGIPLSLLAASFVPGLWLSGLAWALFGTLLFLFDAMFAALGMRPDFALRVPSAIAIGKTAEAQLSLRFSGRGTRAARGAPEVRR